MKRAQEAGVRMVVAGVVVAGVALLVALAVGVGRVDDPVRSAVARWRGARFHGIGDGVLQLGSNDCGPAALAHCLRRLGRPVPYPDPDSGIRLSREGCTFEQLVAESARRNWNVTWRRVEAAELRGIAAPAILYLRPGHFVVYEGRSDDGRYVFHDPALGRLSYGLGNLVRRWGGEVLHGVPDSVAPGPGAPAPAEGLDSGPRLVDPRPR